MTIYCNRIIHMLARLVLRHVSHFGVILRQIKPALVLVGRVFTYGPGDLCSIPDRIIPKTSQL